MSSIQMRVGLTAHLGQIVYVELDIHIGFSQHGNYQYLMNIHDLGRETGIISESGPISFFLFDYEGCIATRVVSGAA